MLSARRRGAFNRCQAFAGLAVWFTSVGDLYVPLVPVPLSRGGS